MTPRRLQTAIDKGLAFIASEQAADGSFQSFSSPTQSPFRPNLAYQTTFTPALILGALAALGNKNAQRIRHKLTHWLLAQKSPHWSFNYWATASPERQRLTYPDDLDDTFCALIALHQHDPSLIDQTVLAKVVKLLIATETKVGGPYRTWLTDKSAPKVWQDVDLAVNANIAGFLRLVAEPLPNVTELIEKAIANRSFRSPYYPSIYPIVYYIARAYGGRLAPDLANYIIGKRRGGWWNGPLQTALSVSSLVRLGQTEACRSALERLVVAQQPDGSWPAEAFCIDPAIKSKTHYSGATALTTAFVVEALASANQAVQRPGTARQDKTDKTADQLYRQITAAVEHDVRGFGLALQQQVRAGLKRTRTNDNSHEITLLAYFFNQSLLKPLAATPPDLFVELGAANVHGWTAYTIYDDFLDGEGNPSALSAANATLRYSVGHFRQALPDNKEFEAYTTQMFDVVDNANAWELAHCRMATTNKTITVSRLPRYANRLDLADRSIGHTLTPLAVLAAAGIAPSDPQAKLISLALRHYIVARQLHDDLHDWEQDLRAGIITYVVAQLLGELRIPQGSHTFAKLIPKLQKHFWHQTMPDVCAIISRHTTLARRAARANGLLTEPNIITRLTEKIDLSVQKTLTEQDKAEAFLKAYTAD